MLQEGCLDLQYYLVLPVTFNNASLGLLVAACYSSEGTLRGTLKKGPRATLALSPGGS